MNRLVQDMNFISCIVFALDIDENSSWYSIRSQHYYSMQIKLLFDAHNQILNSYEEVCNLF